MSQYSYRLILDIEKDAWNWYDACSHVGFGVDWKKRIDEDIASQFVGKSQQDAYAFLAPYIEKKYEDARIKQGRAFIEQQFNDKFVLACDKLVELTGKPLYRSDFTLYLTTFPRGPYDFNTGSLWVVVDFINPIANFMHEVLHFQFIQYWRLDSTSRVSKLSEDNFEMLKESLTVILDDSLIPLIERADGGYEIHRAYRAKLHEHWMVHHDFGELIEYGLSILDGYRS